MHVLGIDQAQAEALGHPTPQALIDDVARRMTEMTLLRESGAVTRMHCRKHIGLYDVAQHSYNALSMLLCWHPAPSAALMRCVLWHDCAERHLGDVPAPAKWENAALCEAYEAAELAYIQHHHPRLYEDLQGLSEDDRGWLRLVDGMELLMWSAEQMQLGAAASSELGKVGFRILKSLQKRTLPPMATFILRVFVENTGIDKIDEEDLK